MTSVRSRSLEFALEELVYRSAEPNVRVAHHRRVAEALIDVVDERIRQEDIGDRKREQGIDWRSCADPDMAGGDLARLAVLAEEFGEVARAILEAGYGSGTPVVVAHWDHQMRAELVQVAAVSVAWVEAIDARALPF